MACLALVATLLLPQAAWAYTRYSISNDAGNCADCHGGFRDGGYVSLADGEPWNNSLHDVHESLMLGGDCNTCHTSPGRFPVFLGSSNGGNGLPAFSCAGCHGRLEDANALAGDRSLRQPSLRRMMRQLRARRRRDWRDSGTRERRGTLLQTEGFGAGLRQHHWRSGITDCVSCHTDSDPAAFTPVGENVPPPYYADPGIDHPAIPSNACSPAPGLPEDFAGSSFGLDSDGDLVYDGADDDCAPAICADGHVPDDVACDNGIFCDGVESCDAALGCQAGTPESCDDGVSCTNDRCDAVSDSCVNTVDDNACDNGIFCDGQEICDAAVDCQSGPDVDCNDDDLCTDDSCNESAGHCDNLFDPTNDPSCQALCPDTDGDGFSTEGDDCGAVDCDDNDATVYPGAAEICDDDRDNDCDGLLDAAASACGSDGSTEAHPGPLQNDLFAGSSRCGECHQDHFEDWQSTLHARMQIRPGDAQAAGFPLPEPDPETGVEVRSWNDVLFVLGQKWRTAYVGKDGRIQGSQWNYLLGSWVPHDDGNLADYDCGGCHTTGYDASATFLDGQGQPVTGIVGSWTEYSIGCEACHGPGAEHADAPRKENINRILFDWYDPDDDGSPDPVGIRSSLVCANCHFRGDRGSVRTDRQSREQHNDWLVSPHSKSLEFTTLSTYCAKCHSPGNAHYLSTEHNFRYFEPSDATHVACISCHNPHQTSQPRWDTLMFPPGPQDPRGEPAAIARYRGTDRRRATSDFEAFDNQDTNSLCRDCHRIPGFRRHKDAREPEEIVLNPPPVHHETIIDRHHLLYGTVIPSPTDAPYGTPGELYVCLSCHAVDTSSGSNQFLIERDCQVCHHPDPHLKAGESFLVPHRWHVDEGNAECVDCHMAYSRRSVNPDDIRSHVLWPNEWVVDPSQRLPHFDETCGQCHSQAKHCTWCHSEFVGR
jgi:hypothetical protein